MSFPRQLARTRRFTTGVPYAFEISPDGGRVAFLRGRDGIDTATCLWVHETSDGTAWVAADPHALGADDENLPPEERARRERLRESGGGIVSYSVDEAFTRAVFTLSGRLFYVDLVGDDNALWKPLPGFFTPGTPLYNEEGGEILKGKRDIAGAKKLLAESSYKGEPVTCVVAQDQSITKAQGDVTAELLKRIGMTVDFVATDWGTVTSRPRRSGRAKVLSPSPP